jgi:hypothetical protein
MLPRRSPNGWSDSRSASEDIPMTNMTRAPSNVLKIKIPAKLEDPVERSNSQGVGRKVKKPAAKAVSAPSTAKSLVTGEDKAAKAGAVSVAKAKVAKPVKAKFVKEMKVKPVKEAGVQEVKESTGNPAKVKAVKELNVEDVNRELRVKKELIESKLEEGKEPRVRKAPGTTRRRSEFSH